MVGVWWLWRLWRLWWWLLCCVVVVVLTRCNRRRVSPGRCIRKCSICGGWLILGTVSPREVGAWVLFLSHLGRGVFRDKRQLFVVFRCAAWLELRDGEPHAWYVPGQVTCTHELQGGAARHTGGETTVIHAGSGTTSITDGTGRSASRGSEPHDFSRVAPQEAGG